MASLSDVDLFAAVYSFVFRLFWFYVLFCLCVYMFIYICLVSLYVSECSLPQAVANECLLVRTFKTRDMLINLEKEVGLVPGLDTNGLSWIRTFQRRLQLLVEEGEMSSLLEGSVAPELPEF